MSHAFTPTVYIRLRKRATIPPGQTVTLGRVAQLLTEPDMERTLMELPLVKPSERDGNIVLIDMMHIVRTIRSVAPHIKIEYFGDPHVLIDIETKPKRPNRLALAVVWLLLFIGSGLAIMNFHEDVSMMEVHQRIYEMVTGEWVEHPYWLQIPYSLGLGAGMVLFFNQLFKKRFTEEPSPLEVELFTYQQSLNQYVITEEYQKMASVPSGTLTPGEDKGSAAESSAAPRPTEASQEEGRRP
ncbi:stage V sporulation protein AA [Paenibacillus hodogayensis]|uniref:Stage V sporulation protein AA n=1 Tax=Paenibacillus hodogayensis TaxID=279208 RepID=A0ABV5W5Y1_9BACL